MIVEQLDQDLKAALKEKNETTVSSLRNIKAAFKNAEIEKKAPLDDADAIKVLSKKVKQHKDSIESFAAGSRNDLVEIEMAQMKVLEKYLPKGMEESEVRELVAQVISDLSATPADFGKVMKEASTRAAGRTDGGKISKLVKEMLK